MFYMIKNSAPYAEIKLTIPLLDVKTEAFHLLENKLYATHRSNDAQGWNVFTLYGEGAYMTIGGDYGDKQNYHWTDLALRHCPKTVEWVQNLPYTELYRVRFMFLESEGYIKIHHDKEPEEQLGYTQVDDAMNIAISHPKDCYMRMVYENKFNDVPFKDGTSFFFNNRYFHYVYNPSINTRIHMIIHAKWLPLDLQYPKLKLHDLHYLKHPDFIYSNNSWNNKKALDEKIRSYSPDLSDYC